MTGRGMTGREACQLAAQPEPALIVETWTGGLTVDAELLDCWTRYGWPDDLALARLASAQQRGEQL